MSIATSWRGIALVDQGGRQSIRWLTNQYSIFVQYSLTNQRIFVNVGPIHHNLLGNLLSHPEPPPPRHYLQALTLSNALNTQEPQ